MVSSQSSPDGAWWWHVYAAVGTAVFVLFAVRFWEVQKKKTPGETRSVLSVPSLPGSDPIWERLERADRLKAQRMGPFLWAFNAWTVLVLIGVLLFAVLDIDESGIVTRVYLAALAVGLLVVAWVYVRVRRAPPR